MKKFYRVITTAIALIVVAALCNLRTLHAESARSPYQAEVSIHGPLQKLITETTHHRSSSKVGFEKIQAIEVRAKVWGEGSIRARFSLRRNKTWRSYFTTPQGEIEDTTVPLLLKGRLYYLGTMKRGSGATPVAASVINNVLQLSFNGKARGRKNRSRSYQLTINLKGGKAVVGKIASVSAAARASRTCGMDAQVAERSSQIRSASKLTHGAPLTSASMIHARAATKEAEIATETDHQFYSLFGTSSNATIAAIINAADVIYERDLSVTLSIGTQHTYTSSSPFSATDPNTLLDAFIQNNISTGNLGSSGDLKHLFTGKDLDGNVVGLAYVGVLCNSTWGAGLTQYYSNSNFTAYIFAHELGHNFGAGHDSSVNDGNLMYPSASSNLAGAYLTTTSKSAINSHITSYGSCLAAVSSSTPTPTPTATPTPSLTPTPTMTPTPSPSATPTITPTPSPTISPTPSPSKSPTPKPTSSPTASPTAQPTVAVSPTPTPTPTAPQHTITLNSKRRSRTNNFEFSGVVRNYKTKAVRNRVKAQLYLDGTLVRSALTDRYGAYRFAGTIKSPLPTTTVFVAVGKDISRPITVKLIPSSSKKPN